MELADDKSSEDDKCIHILRWSSSNWNENESTPVIAFCGAFGVCQPNGVVCPPDFDFYDPGGAWDADPMTCVDCIDVLEDMSGLR